jgi:hypothetical protein
MAYVAPIRDQTIVDAYRRAILRRPEPVTIERLTGSAPNVTSISVTVDAVVRNVTADATNEDVEGKVRIGNIPQSAVEILVMSADLEDAGFPVPVEEYDKVTLSSTGTRLTIINVDSHKRALGGAIEIKAAGVE